jgi:phosphatidylglycerol lysyltransferase
MLNKNENRFTVLKKYGKNSLSYLTLADDNQYYSGNWNGYIAYKEFFRSVVILGNPIISENDYLKVIEDIRKKFISKKCHICFFLCNKEIVNYLNNAGFKCLYVGDEAVIDLEKFDISGKKGWSIRSSINYAKRINMIVEEYDINKKRSKDIESEIKKISDEWCKTNKLPEFRFAFGEVDFDKKSETRFFICKDQGKIVGFINYYPIYGINSYYLDLTRRSKDAPRGVIDYLYVTSFNKLKEEGIKKIFIGYSPITSFSKIDKECKQNMSILFRNIFSIFYPAKSEFFFKKKYATEWEPNYFCYYPRLSFRVLFSVLHAICNGGLGKILIKKIKRKIPF